MSTADKIGSLRWKRGHQVGRFTSLSKRLDEYEQSGQHNESTLLAYVDQLNDAWNQFNAIQSELEDFDEEERERFLKINDHYLDLVVRLKQFIKTAQLASPLKPTSGESVTVSGPIAIKLPEIHLSQFDGTIENWEFFYNTFFQLSM
jgi:hypothetical protein